MRDELDDILKSRLHDAEIREGLPGWDRVERSIIAAEKKEKKRKAFFWLGGVYRYAAVALILIGLGYVGYKLLFKDTLNKYVAGNVSSEFAQESSGTESAEGMGVESNTAHVEYKPVQEVSPDNEEITTVNVSLSAIPSSLESFIPNVNDKNNDNDAGSHVDNTDPNGLFFAVIPELSLLTNPQTGLINESEFQIYDIDGYLAEFYGLYGEDSDEDAVNKWHQILMADALAVNRSSESSRFGFDNSLSINSYYGNTFEDKGLTYKLDNVLVDKYAEQIGVIVSTYNYDRLTNLFPFSLSLGVGRDIGTRMGIESGLLYSFMKSYSGAITWTSIYFEQKLQYLGVPVTLYYSLLPENSNWDIDIRGGITAEKALSAIGTTMIYENYVATESSVNDEVPSNIMLSGHAGVGFGYSLFRNFGLYAEPAFEYYFYTKGQPVSYRTDNPFRFNLRAGVRFNF